MAGAERREEVAGQAGPYSWRRLGQGPPLVLLNGYAASAEDWDPTFLGALAERSTVLCPDNRGMGDSARGPEPLSMAAMARDALAMLDSLGIDSAPIAGWSMGGFVAQELAALAPERVEALVLISTDPGGARAIRASAEVWRSSPTTAGARASRPGG